MSRKGEPVHPWNGFGGVPARKSHTKTGSGGKHSRRQNSSLAKPLPSRLIPFKAKKRSVKSTRSPCSRRWSGDVYVKQANISATTTHAVQSRLANALKRWAKNRRNAYVWVSQTGVGSWRFELSVGSWPECREIRASQALRILEEHSTEFEVSNVEPIKAFSFSQQGAAPSIFEVGPRPFCAPPRVFSGTENRSRSTRGEKSCLKGNLDDAEVKLIPSIPEEGDVISPIPCRSSVSFDPANRPQLSTGGMPLGGNRKNDIETDAAARQSKRRKSRPEAATSQKGPASRKSMLMLNAGLSAQAALAAAISASKVSD